MSEIFQELSQRLERVRADFAQEMGKTDETGGLEALRVKYLGRKSELLALMKGMAGLEDNERPRFGQIANQFRTMAEAALTASLKQARADEEARLLKEEALDITLPGQGSEQGCRHPLQQTIDLIAAIFLGMGYQIAEGPELEWVHNNFDLLRIPEGHPSRDVRDTYYVNDEVLLRTQTSPVQVRVMRSQKPPIKVICPGRVYRPDTPDATHSPVFHQIEGLVVDRGVAMSDLVGTLQLFARELFGEETQIRLRPHHFPFTEPSCEVDVTCWRCGGEGCPTCKNEGFVEVLGAGMVHPWVLEQSGIDPAIYSGFAFGIGAERTAMARFGVDDIRNFYENSLDFLKQFK